MIYILHAPAHGGVLCAAQACDFVVNGLELQSVGRVAPCGGSETSGPPCTHRRHLSSGPSLVQRNDASSQSRQLVLSRHCVLEYHCTAALLACTSAAAEQM
jgi:hypothetical protein